MPRPDSDTETRATRSATGLSGRDDLRSHNLGVILTAVHRSRQQSRSELAAQTGLNRSTISSLVAELVQRGLVEEGEPEATFRAGRPSPVVRPGPRPVAFAANPEIDAITVSTVGLSGNALRTIRVPMATPPTVDLATRVIHDTVAELRAGLPPDSMIIGLGVAVPGLVSSADGSIRLAPHLGWRDVDLGAALRAATGLSVNLRNDAHVGSLAESIFGAGGGEDDVLYLNGGASGIGGGIVARGAALDGSAGYAGEIGHTLVNSAGTSCHCGATGCLETEVRRERLLRVLDLREADHEQLEQSLRLSETRETEAEVSRQLGFLGVALRNAVNLLNPHTIILGGFLRSLYLRAPDELIRAVTSASLDASAADLRIVPSTLGSDILAIGAAEIAFAPLLANPASY